MPVVQIATRLEKKEKERFEKLANDIGTTPANALKMFIVAFNLSGGFPFLPKISALKNTAPPVVEPFVSEREATDFSTRISKRVFNESR